MPPLTFSADEVGLLLNGQDRSRLKGCREYALELFLFDIGVRATECFEVRLEEVEWEQQHVLLHGKGNNQRHVGAGLPTKANPHRFRYTWATASGAREIDV